MSLPSNASIRLMIVDDHQLRRECLAFVLAREDDISVTDLASSFPEAITRAKARPPDIILVDACRAEANALELLGKMREDLTDVMLIVMGLSGAESEVLDWIEAGANGHLPKDACLTELLDVIRSVHSSGAMCTPTLAYSACSRVAELIRKRTNLDLNYLTNLTKRELEIVQLLADGLSNEQIAERLYLSPYTIKNHVHNILEKLQVHSRLEAVRLASRKGLIKEDD